MGSEKRQRPMKRILMITLGAIAWPVCAVSMLLFTVPFRDWNPEYWKQIQETNDE